MGGLVAGVLQVVGVEFVEGGEVAAETEPERADGRGLSGGFVEVGPVQDDLWRWVAVVVIVGAPVVRGAVR
ncbi:hypothetical protein [Streptomyces aureocirculatus]|uniref:hypothetical protein n=1 Tax=Streptomyces aureocirculatus TaxID=67275 RepID=UPI001CEDAC7D|nr:hypothetical protein [Streptomyces aureocirculatus]